VSPGAARVRAGFTLVETLIALVLSMVILLLVSHTFLVQNQFYATQTLRVGAQDNVRAATELMASEVRNVAEGGVVVAGARTLTVRSPMAIGVLCDVSGSGHGRYARRVSSSGRTRDDLPLAAADRGRRGDDLP
jgi:Tfp pilus assembly protein PilW